MPPKAVIITPFTVATTLGLGGDTNIRDNDLKVVIIYQLRSIIKITLIIRHCFSKYKI